MNVIMKKNILLIMIVTIFASSISAIRSDQQLSAKFEIIPHPDWTNAYEAKITLVNKGPKLSNGWQLQFNFSSPDQTIKKISSGITPLNESNQIIITNLAQHIRTSAGGQRVIKIIVNKNPNTIPQIPTITTIANAPLNSSPKTLHVAAV